MEYIKSKEDFFISFKIEAYNIFPTNKCGCLMRRSFKFLPLIIYYVVINWIGL